MENFVAGTKKKKKKKPYQYIVQFLTIRFLSYPVKMEYDYLIRL